MELKTEPTTEQKTRNLTAKDLTGSFIITPGSSGCEFGAIYSQANLEIRAPYSQKDDGNHNTFMGRFLVRSLFPFHTMTSAVAVVELIQASEKTL